MNKEKTMKSKHLRWILYCALAAGLVAGSFLAGKAIARPGVARAEAPAGSAAPDVPGAAHFRCPAIDQVAAFNNRIHVHCTTAVTVGSDSVSYFAYPTDAAHANTANQMLAVGNSAFALGTQMDLFYNADSALNPTGCNTGDCRGLVGVDMLP
jgi:hypothetical protein